MNDQNIRAELNEVGQILLLMLEDYDISDDEAHVRLVACVNACYGIPTQDLEGIGQFAGNGSSVLKKLSETRYQRDNLLKVISEVRKFLTYLPNLPKPLMDDQCLRILEKLRSIPERFES